MAKAESFALYFFVSKLKRKKPSILFFFPVFSSEFFGSSRVLALENEEEEEGFLFLQRVRENFCVQSEIGAKKEEIGK